MIFRILPVLVFTIVSSSADTDIFWSSAQDATNLTSGGSAMDASFRFELGVFNPGFEPKPENIADWVANWNPVKRTSYKAGIKRFSDSHTVPFSPTANAAPFTAGTPAYVWGFRGDPTSGEWILLHAASWEWPTISNGPPDFRIWDTSSATAVIGSINQDGVLMRSASVSNLPPPTTNYVQWVIDELEGETLTAADQDADGDGIANVLEFISGTSPTLRSPSPFVTSLADVSGSRYLQISVPRRSDRPASVTVQVSGDLVSWDSDQENTVQVSSTNSLLVVRDLNPISPSNPRRFIRVKATLP